MAATQPADVCAAFWSAKEVVAVEVSGDGALLAVSSPSLVQVFLLHSLSLGERQPLYSWPLPSGTALAQVGIFHLCFWHQPAVIWQGEGIMGPKKSCGMGENVPQK